MILEGGGLQLPEIGASHKRTRRMTALKAGTVVWQWVATFKEAVPPPPLEYIGGDIATLSFLLG